jgi:hypothetical protein
LPSQGNPTTSHCPCRVQVLRILPMLPFTTRVTSGRSMSSTTERREPISGLSLATLPAAQLDRADIDKDSCRRFAMLSGAARPTVEHRCRLDEAERLTFRLRLPHESRHMSDSAFRVAP